MTDRIDTALAGMPRFSGPGNCTPADADAMYDGGVVMADYLKRTLCPPCPIALECLTWALENREEGIWGGTTAEERSTILKKRAGVTPTGICVDCGIKLDKKRTLRCRTCHDKKHSHVHGTNPTCTGCGIKLIGIRTYAKDPAKYAAEGVAAHHGRGMCNGCKKRHDRNKKAAA